MASLTQLVAFGTIGSVSQPVGVASSLENASGSCSPERADLTQVGQMEQASWLNALDSNAHPLVRPLKRHLQRTRNLLAKDSPKSSTLTTLPLDDAAIDWAWRANAVWITEDRKVYDPAGRLLLDNERLQEPTHSHPEAVIPSPVDARQRQAEVQIEMRNRLVDPVEGLLPIPGIDEVQSVDAAIVAKRTLALFLIATRAESMLASRPLEVERMRKRCPIGFEAMSPNELSFMADAEGATAAGSMVWRYESLMTLQWALDMQFELPWPDEHADLTAVTRLMVDLPDEEIIEQARLRSTEQLLTEAERHYQLYFVIAQAQSAGQDLPAGLDPGVICERLIAFTWLLGLNAQPADQDNCWDDAVAWVEEGRV